MLLIGSISFFAIWLVVHFGSRLRSKFVKNTIATTDAPGPSGATRGVYQLFFVLILWSFLIFLIPLLLSYHQHIIAAATRRELIDAVCKAVFLPILFLLLVAYGQRRGYLRWLNERSWPRERE